MGASNVRTVAIATGTTDVDPDTKTELKGEMSLYGWSFRESAVVAAVATIIIRDGLADTAPIVAVIELAADKSTDPPPWFGPQGIRINSGVFIERAVGETEGAVYIG